MSIHIWLFALAVRAFSAFGAVYINEVAPSGGGGVCAGQDWVELHNDASGEVDISGYRICDRNGCSDVNAFTFPANSKIVGNGYIVVCKNESSSAGFNFGIGRTDTISFADTGGNELSATGKMKGRSDQYTFARLTGGQFDYGSSATPGAANVQTLAPFACTTDLPCWNLFDQNTLRTYNLEIAQSDLAKMIADVREEIYVPCTVTVNYQTSAAEVYPHAGCRTKGNQGAFLHCEGQLRKLTTGATKLCRKLSIKADANYFNQSSNDRFHDQKKLQFHSMNADNSLMFERLAYNIMQRANFFAPRAMHAKVVVNGVTSGIHLLVEQIDDRFLDLRLPDRVVRNSTVYKELWPGGGCTNLKPQKTCGKEQQWCNVEQCAKSCVDDACGFAPCHQGKCWASKTDSRCASKPNGFNLRDGGICAGFAGQNFRVAPCIDQSAPNQDCYLTHRRDGNGDYRNLYVAIGSEAEACVNSDCSESQASQIVDKYFNRTALVDAYVATLYDMDQFTTVYGYIGHNFYSVVNENFVDGASRVTMIPWDFDRGFALCETSACPGGGYLGDLTMNAKAPVPEGNLEMQRNLADWGRCHMPPWYTIVTRIPELNQKYCIDGVMTFAPHIHMTCKPVLNLFARALKSEYATRMTQLLTGAEAWAAAQITAYRAQIRAAVIEDANQGGFPTLAQWDGTITSTPEQANKVFAWGRQLAAGAAAADTTDSPTPAATECFKNGNNSNNPLLYMTSTTTATTAITAPGGANNEFSASVALRLAMFFVCLPLMVAML